jgi:DNA-binding beta-propeller fold protein YncE
MVKLFAFSFFVIAALLLGANNTWAVELLRVIPIPGFSDLSDPANPHAASFDIGWVDRGTYYLADRGPTATAYGDCGGRVDVIDADDNLDFICGFVGNVGGGISGPNGILVIPSVNELWVGDGDSTVKVVDLNTRAIVATIPTGGTKRADELAYDSVNDRIVVANDADDPPFLTFIDRASHEVLGSIVYDGSDFFHPLATDGLEQPVFDDISGMIYQAVPEVDHMKDGEIDEIDPFKMQVTRRFELDDCVPHGLTLGPRNHLLAGCSDVSPTQSNARSMNVIDDRTGELLARIRDVAGADEVWYNRGDNTYYIAASNCPSDYPPCGGPVLGLIDAETNQFIENVPTATGAHSVAVNPRNNQVFVPRGPVSGPGSDTPGVAVYGSNN